MSILLETINEVQFELHIPKTTNNQVNNPTMPVTIKRITFVLDNLCFVAEIEIMVPHL
jgi:hypothetical protein